jgi:hypothetical protein
MRWRPGATKAPRREQLSFERDARRAPVGNGSRLKGKEAAMRRRSAGRRFSIRVTARHNAGIVPRPRGPGGKAPPLSKALRGIWPVPSPLAAYGTTSQMVTLRWAPLITVLSFDATVGGDTD